MIYQANMSKNNMATLMVDFVLHAMQNTRANGQYPVFI